MKSSLLLHYLAIIGIHYLAIIGILVMSNPDDTIGIRRRRKLLECEQMNDESVKMVGSRERDRGIVS